MWQIIWTEPDSRAVGHLPLLFFYLFSTIFIDFLKKKWEQNKQKLLYKETRRKQHTHKKKSINCLNICSSFESIKSSHIIDLISCKQSQPMWECIGQVCPTSNMLFFIVQKIEPGSGRFLFQSLQKICLAAVESRMTWLCHSNVTKNRNLRYLHVFFVEGGLTFTQ